MSQTTGTLNGVFQAGMPVQQLGPTTVRPNATSPATVMLTSGLAYDVTLTQGTAFTLGVANGAAIGQVILILRQSGSGGFVPVLPTPVKWPGGTAPTPNSTAGEIDCFKFTTSDGGVTWFGGAL